VSRGRVRGRMPRLRTPRVVLRHPERPGRAVAS
jgi:hypothetical protein